MPSSKKNLRQLRAAKETRATVQSDDVFGGRSFGQSSSDVQKKPEGDSRYRVNASAKFYVVQLIGSWVHISESAQRTIHYQNRLKYVRFENKQHQLRKATEFKGFVSRFINGGCYAYIGSKQVNTLGELGKVEAFPFIYIASSEALRKFNETKQEHLARQKGA